ncbi:type IV pilus assembly protein PilV [Amphritea atlantica]|uniref:Type IV pilus assembly protein PilV n=1 Tax=Amphritea atlantica TaxID=355243 RepID=A0A1H9LNK5_9GAMM|nr:type IV pilus modification protein PilV [Amphritea atlantica]SER12715.1 type IV pilus assembly protein PilV [Amphritea atlantica]
MSRQGCGLAPGACSRTFLPTYIIPRRQCGTSLIEVLVTLVLVAIGMVGMMTMQARGLQQNQSAYLRTQAIAIANDMADRIRLNKQAGLDDYYALTLSQDAQSFSTAGVTDSAKKLAYSDLHNWLSWVAVSLPEGDAEIKRSSQRITIVINWNGRRDQGGISRYQHEVDL